MFVRVPLVSSIQFPASVGRARTRAKIFRSNVAKLPVMFGFTGKYKPALTVRAGDRCKPAGAFDISLRDGETAPATRLLVFELPFLIYERRPSRRGALGIDDSRESALIDLNSLANRVEWKAAIDVWPIISSFFLGHRK